jgi:hypothetical protein
MGQRQKPGATDPFVPPVYRGEQDAERLPYSGPGIATDPQGNHRGHKAPMEGSGVVSGSGATAGGGGDEREDYDVDPVAGGAASAMPTSKGKPSGKAP